MSKTGPIIRSSLAELESRRQQSSGLSTGQDICLKSLQAYPDNGAATALLMEELAHEAGLAHQPSTTAREALKAIRLASIASAINIEQTRQSSVASKEHTDSVYATLVSEKLNSEIFTNFLRGFNADNERAIVIGLAIEYLIFHKDGYDFDKYLDGLKKKSSAIQIESCTTINDDFTREKNKLLIESIRKKLDLSETSNANDEQVFKYFNQEFIENGFFFHSFNGAFEDSVRANGLTRDIRFWDLDDVKRITEIGRRTGSPMLAGWADKNCENQLSIGERSSLIYRYATVSPEWYAQFVSEGFHILSEGQSENKRAFASRDYELCRQNLIRFCHHNNMPAADREILIAFFEKYWRVFAAKNSSPKLAMIKRSAIPGGYNLAMNKSLKAFAERPYHRGNVLEAYFRTYLHGAYLDVQLNEDIKPCDFEIVSLPEQRKVYQ